MKDTKNQRISFVVDDEMYERVVEHRSTIGADSDSETMRDLIKRGSRGYHIEVGLLMSFNDEFEEEDITEVYPEYGNAISEMMVDWLNGAFSDSQLDERVDFSKVPDEDIPSIMRIEKGKANFEDFDVFFSAMQEGAVDKVAMAKDAVKQLREEGAIDA